LEQFLKWQTALLQKLATASAYLPNSRQSGAAFSAPSYAKGYGRVPHKDQGREEEGLQTIIKTMARGWESKAVEAQQAEAGEKSRPARPKLSPEQAARSREIESLRLSRQRVLGQLERSRNPRHRQLLEDALADLNQKLADLGN
jgi:hypothetical protein